MKPKSFIYLGLLLLAGGLTASSATDRFVALDGGHVPPFTSWSDAATNIQDAIDAASAGDIVWVTNGVYATGGKVMVGDLVNRVALDKALTVKSVNGPFVTTIQGNGAFTGTTAVRCAWLTNGATLYGFTITDGGTRQVGNFTALQAGGGVWSASTEATVANCVITTNAGVYGGAAYQGTLRNCLVRGNQQIGAYGADLINCTVISNTSWGASTCKLTNSILAYNNGAAMSSLAAYCCSPSFVNGIGNIIADPRLLPDGIHLADDSPCRYTGTTVASGVDLDGEAWANPPSIGCDQYPPRPVINGQLRVQITNNPIGFSISVATDGQRPFTCWWFHDTVPLEDNNRYTGAHTTNLVATGIFPSDVGNYQVVISNVFGVTTGAVQVVGHYVNAAAANPMPPYSTWETAATNIQDAIDVAQLGIVVVTNGIYATGGKVKAGGLTNRVALDKPIPVLSVNGPGVTIIQGQWDPTTTNGPLAVRCAWMANGTILSGFTLRNGATLDTNNINLASGGGVWCSSVDAQLINCRIVDNFAGLFGGGAYDGTLNNCIVSNNAGSFYCRGGGAAYGTLINCLVVANSADSGGGTYSGRLYNCAVIRNFARYDGSGCDQSRLDNCTVSLNSVRTLATGYGVSWIGVDVFARNCIIWNNDGLFNYRGGKLTNSCTYPPPSGNGNISVDPQLLGDGYHLAATSPCIGAGSSLFVAGTDIDGQSWGGPPSIGCDEWHPEPLVVVPPLPRPTVSDGQVQINVGAAGDPSIHCTWTKDGQTVADDIHYTNSSSASLLIRDFGVGDAGAYQVVVSNAFGVVTSQVVHVTVRCVDVASATPATPHTTWESAATTIQDAVDVAGPNNVILVTNGVYASGGRPKSGDLTNRVVIDRPMLIASVNGPDHTVIQGQWDPVSTNGPAAVRCAWLGDGAALSGFTLRNGATTAAFNYYYDSIGGGALCSSTNAELANCIITNCRARGSGGGVYAGLVRNSRLAGNAVASTSGLIEGGGAAAYSTLINSLVIRNTSAGFGGGVSTCWLYNCAVIGNTAGNSGGGADGTRMVNCTVTANSAMSAGGGVRGGLMTNCIISLNFAPSSPNVFSPLFSQFTCSTPVLAGVGNIADDPQLTDGWHLSATSPCRGMGIVSAATGTDLDGDPWANPPSMGCDEVYDAALVGPLSVSLSAAYPEVAAYGSLPLMGQVSGRASRVEWSFGEGTSFTNLSSLTFHTWTNPGDYLVTFTAYNTDHPGGVATNLTVHVVPLSPPPLTAEGLSGANFTLSFPGQAGITYVVEQATNLATPINWQPVQTLISTGALIQVTDPKATNVMRFYRTRRQ